MPKAKEKVNPIPTKEWEEMGTGRKSPYVKPFNCDESRLLALAGDIVANAVYCYRYAGKVLADLEAERKAGIHDEEIRKWEEIRKVETENEEELRKYRRELEEYKDAVARYELALELIVSKGLTEKELLREPIKPKIPTPKRVPYRGESFPYHDEKRKAEMAMANERIFFRSPTYQRLCKVDGNDVLAELDRQLAEYKGKIRRKASRKKAKRKGRKDV